MVMLTISSSSSSSSSSLPPPLSPSPSSAASYVWRNRARVGGGVYQQPYNLTSLTPSSTPWRNLQGQFTASGEHCFVRDQNERRYQESEAISTSQHYKALIVWSDQEESLTLHKKPAGCLRTPCTGVCMFSDFPGQPKSANYDHHQFSSSMLWQKLCMVNIILDSSSLS